MDRQHSDSRPPPDPLDPTLPAEDRKALLRWAAPCAERLLPLTGRSDLDEAPLRAAARTAAAFARGDATVSEARERAFACHAAARASSHPASVATARVFGQMIAVAHMGGHARRIAPYTRKALLAAGLGAEDVEAELARQREALPIRYRTYVYGG